MPQLLTIPPFKYHHPSSGGGGKCVKLLLIPEGIVAAVAIHVSTEYMLALAMTESPTATKIMCLAAGGLCSKIVLFTLI